VAAETGTVRGEDLWTAVCVALVVAIAVVDVALGGGLETVLVAGPVVASTQLPARRTAALAGLALAAGFAVAAADGILGRLPVILRLLASAGVGGVAVVAARSRQRREARLARLARVAEVSQQAILRPIPRRAGPVHLAARYLSAAEDAIVGGDLYDVVVNGGSARLIVGDVRGKGLDAIRLAALVMGLFREAAAVESDLAAVAKAVDSAIANHLGEEDFVTAVFAEFAAGWVSVVNCGHHRPLRIGPDQVAVLTAAEPTRPLGLGPDFVTETHPFQPGERLLIFTDGLIEARDDEGAFFDLARLPEHFFTRASLDATLDALVRHLLAHVGGRLDDDLAVVLVEPVGLGAGVA
jgi:phosphoserine phosphatase RsbU/P